MTTCTYTYISCLFVEMRVHLNLNFYNCLNSTKHCVSCVILLAINTCIVQCKGSHFHFDPVPVLLNVSQTLHLFLEFFLCLYSQWNACVGRTLFL